MRICDRCKNSPVIEMYTGSREGAQIDFCVDCNNAFKEFLIIKKVEQADKPATQKKRASRKKK